MFTGLVECTGTIISLKRSQDIVEMEIEAADLSGELYHGQSISVSGVCLTVTAFGHSSFTVEMMPETAGKTTFSRISPGRKVNLERALKSGSRLDGHFVTGHIDGIGIIEQLKQTGRSVLINIATEPAVLAQIVPKGSIAVDGISLTIIDVTPKYFSVGIIPTTLKDTTLELVQRQDSVNLETDILGKYVHRLLFHEQNIVLDKDTEALTWEKLSGYGWTSV